MCVLTLGRRPFDGSWQIFHPQFIPKSQASPIRLLPFEAVVQIWIREKDGHHLLPGPIPHPESPAPSEAALPDRPEKRGLGDSPDLRKRVRGGVGFRPPMFSKTEVKMHFPENHDALAVQDIRLLGRLAQPNLADRYRDPGP